MNKTVCAKVVLFLLATVLFAFSSCKGEEDIDFKKGRQTFMSNDATIRIVRPLERDTIIYKESKGGFAMNIENKILTTTSFDLGDTITIREEKKDIRVTLKFDNFQLSDAETFEFDGKGVLYLKARDSSKWQDTIPFVILSENGYIKEKKMVYNPTKEPGKDFLNPYAALYYVGSRIY